MLLTVRTYGLTLDVELCVEGDGVLLLLVLDGRVVDGSETNRDRN